MQQQDSRSDTALVVAITRRDRGALAEVCRRHGDPAYALAVRMVGPERAPEVVQEAVLQLWAEPSIFDRERGPMRAVLVGLVHRRAITMLRANADASIVLDPPEVGPLLSDLPDEESAVLALAYFRGHTYAEVAGLLRQSDQAVMTAMRHGLARLRSRFADPVSEPQTP